MRAFILACILASVGCGGADAPAPNRPKDPVTAPSGGDAKTRTWSVFMKVGDVIAANESDCKTMGEEMKKLTDAEKSALDEVNAWQQQDKAAFDAWMEGHKPELEAWQKKTGAGLKACGDDANVSAAMKALE